MTLEDRSSTNVITRAIISAVSHRFAPLVALILVVYGAVFVATLYSDVGYRGVAFGSSDAQEYLMLAQTLDSAHRFALTPSSLPEVYRTPGYPTFLAILLPISLWAIPIAQLFLTIGSAVLIALLGEMFFSRRVGVLAAAFFALDPMVIAHTFVGLSETLFVFVFLLSIYSLKPPTTLQRAVLGGFLFGLSILIRPIGFFIAPIIFAWVFWGNGTPWKKSAHVVAVALVSCAIVCTPWLLRNLMYGGKFSFSSVGPYDFVLYNIPLFESARTGVAEGEMRAKMYQELGIQSAEELRSFAYVDKENALTKKYIFAHPFQYFFFHSFKSIPFFLGTGFSSSLTMLQLAPASPDINISKMLLDGNLLGVTKIFIETPILFIETAWWVLVFMCALVTFIFALSGRAKNPAFVFFCVTLVAALAFIAGPQAQPRYRIPAEPLYLLLAMEGLVCVIAWLRGAYGRAQNLYKR